MLEISIGELYQRRRVLFEEKDVEGLRNIQNTIVAFKCY